MTQITEQQYSSLRHDIYMMIMIHSLTDSEGNSVELGMGEMGDAEDAAELLVDNWMKKEGITLGETEQQEGEGEFYKTPEIIKEENGVILSVLRHDDNQLIYVGQETKSGGKILTIQKDLNAVGNMCAEIGRTGGFTAITSIVI